MTSFLKSTLEVAHLAAAIETLSVFHQKIDHGRELFKRESREYIRENIREG